MAQTSFLLLGVLSKLLNANSGWEPRGNFIAGAYKNEITIAFGQNATGPLDDSWTTTAEGLGTWVQDFSWGETDQQFYVDEQVRYTG